VFVTKYRRPVFTDAMLTVTETTMRGVCAALDAEWVEFKQRIRPPAPVGRLPATQAISVLVQRLKVRTADAIRREFTGACARARMREHLWSPSYFAVSCGGAPLSIIKQYINAQAKPL
jgi:putative transposase